jgi:CheY-like chemotaxis protein
MALDTARRAKQVLVIEDDAWIRSFIREVLFDEGYCVHEAADGRTGLRLIAECSPDVVLLDLAMPEFTGLDVLHDLRREPRTRALPVVILSAYTRGVLSEQDATSAASVLTKPVDEETLLEVIRRSVASADDAEAALE